MRKWRFALISNKSNDSFYKFMLLAIASYKTRSVQLNASNIAGCNVRNMAGQELLRVSFHVIAILNSFLISSPSFLSYISWQHHCFCVSSGWYFFFMSSVELREKIFLLHVLNFILIVQCTSTIQKSCENSSTKQLLCISNTCLIVQCLYIIRFCNSQRQLQILQSVIFHRYLWNCFSRCLAVSFMHFSLNTCVVTI